MLIKRDFYINGRWVAPVTPRDCDVIDPSTEEACAVISLGDRGRYRCRRRRRQGRLPGMGRHPACRTPRRRGADPGAIRRAARRNLPHAIRMEMGAPIDMARDSQAPCLPWHANNFLTAFDADRMDPPAGPPCARTTASRWNRSASSA